MQFFKYDPANVKSFIQTYSGVDYQHREGEFNLVLSTYNKGNKLTVNENTGPHYKILLQDPEHLPYDVVKLTVEKSTGSFSFAGNGKFHAVCFPGAVLLDIMRCAGFIEEQFHACKSVHGENLPPGARLDAGGMLHMETQFGEFDNHNSKFVLHLQQSQLSLGRKGTGERRGSQDEVAASLRPIMCHFRYFTGGNPVLGVYLPWDFVKKMAAEKLEAVGNWINRQEDSVIFPLNMEQVNSLLYPFSLIETDDSLHGCDFEKQLCGDIIYGQKEREPEDFETMQLLLNETCVEFEAATGEAEKEKNHAEEQMEGEDQEDGSDTFLFHAFKPDAQPSHFSDLNKRKRHFAGRNGKGGKSKKQNKGKEDNMSGKKTATTTPPLFCSSSASPSLFQKHLPDVGAVVNALKEPLVTVAATTGKGEIDDMVAAVLKEFDFSLSSDTISLTKEVTPTIEPQLSQLTRRERKTAAANLCKEKTMGASSTDYCDLFNLVHFSPISSPPFLGVENIESSAVTVTTNRAEFSQTDPDAPLGSTYLAEMLKLIQEGPI